MACFVVLKSYYESIDVSREKRRQLVFLKFCETAAF